MLRDLEHESEDMHSEDKDQDVPSSDELETQYKYFLYKERLKVKCTKGIIMFSLDLTMLIYITVLYLQGGLFIIEGVIGRLTPNYHGPTPMQIV